MMRIWLYVIVCLPVFMFAQNENRAVILSDNIRLNMDEKEEQNFKKSLNAFLIEKDEDLFDSPHIDAENYDKYRDIFNELKFIESNESDSSFYSAYLVNCVKQKEDCYLITLSYRGMNDKLMEEKARITLLAAKKENKFQFLCPFEFYTRDWNQARKGEVVFYVKGKVNDSIATFFSKHNDKMASIFNIKPLDIYYYKCRDLQEAYQLFGIDYHLDINGDKRGCVTIPEEGIFVSGTNSEEYVHDLTHYYFGLQIPKEKRNWVAEEGFNINLTDYWGFSTEDNYEFLKIYLAENDVSILTIFENNRVMRSPIPTKMPVAAVIMKKIEREHGIAGVIEVASCGNTDADFFNAIERIAGITKMNFDDVVRSELYIE